MAEEDGYITELSFMDADTRRKFGRAAGQAGCDVQHISHAPTLATAASLVPAVSSKAPSTMPAVIDACSQELDAYFTGKLKSFTVPIRLVGTDFRMKVWNELCNIPYGETISYKELAQRIGNPRAIRAVGGANHHNPVSIIVPCHRVIGAGGGLTGYGGGLDNKSFLLKLESENLK